ncbi:MAG TPA: hypothetical protein VGN90_13670 [Pyrinomonadaceae bacterium]|nr:hypothetical protein [Pyrinomonadaceae bacterium]
MKIVDQRSLSGVPLATFAFSFGPPLNSTSKLTAAARLAQLTKSG